MFNIIEFIVVTFGKYVPICLFLQIIFTGILVILGPLAFAFSVLPAFRDAYIQWIARFVSVSLYSCICIYSIINFFSSNAIWDRKRN